MNSAVLSNISERFATPSFVFDTDEFAKRADAVKESFGSKVDLCYSVKANPFLLKYLPDCIKNIEVCSPGELSICERSGVDLSRIIYSGVTKGAEDVARAINDGVGILTAESMLHLQLINAEALSQGKVVKLILRLSNGSQFGMDEQVLLDVIDNRAKYTGVDIIGLHYFTGTQKKKAALIGKELDFLDEFIAKLASEHDYKPQHIEYGTGMAAEYFNTPCEEKDIALLSEVGTLIRSFAEKHNTTVEMGRFFASTCGTYLTSVADIKVNSGTNYVICDGGMNHMKYYGQTLAMQVPPITVLNPAGENKLAYSLCGSLCTTADVLVRSVELPKLELGSVLAFGKCGAYTVTEGIYLFLSRTMPRIIMYSQSCGAVLVRDFVESNEINIPAEVSL